MMLDGTAEYRGCRCDFRHPVAWRCGASTQCHASLFVSEQSVHFSLHVALLGSDVEQAIPRQRRREHVFCSLA